MGPGVHVDTTRTRGIIINSPANPTGALISEDELTKVAKFAAGKGIWVLIDIILLITGQFRDKEGHRVTEI